MTSRELPTFDDILLRFEQEFLGPANIDALVALGITFGSNGRLDEAIKQFDRAIEIDPNFWDAWFNKGVALINKKEDAGALECFQMAASIDPNTSTPWLKMGEIHKRRP